MNEVIKSYASKNFKVEIFEDEWLDNPLEGGIAKIVTKRSSYIISDIEDFEFSNCEADIERLEKEYNAAVILPVYCYDHSGISLNTSGFNCRWDSGQIGFIFATKEDIRRDYGVKRISKKLRAKIYDLLDSSVTLLSEYINNENMYRYTIEDLDGDIYDALGGLYGLDYAEEEALSVLKCAERTKQENDSSLFIASGIYEIDLTIEEIA